MIFPFEPVFDILDGVLPRLVGPTVAGAGTATIVETPAAGEEVATLFGALPLIIFFFLSAWVALGLATTAGLLF